MKKITKRKKVQFDMEKNAEHVLAPDQQEHLELFPENASDNDDDGLEPHQKKPKTPEEEDDELPVEKKAKKLLRKRARVEKDSEQELKTNIVVAQDESLAENLPRAGAVPDLQILNDRIKETVGVLQDFKNNCDPNM